MCVSITTIDLAYLDSTTKIRNSRNACFTPTQKMLRGRIFLDATDNLDGCWQTRKWCVASYLTSDVNAHPDNGADGRVHALGIASAGEHGNSLALVCTMLDEPLHRSRRHSSAKFGTKIFFSLLTL